MKSFKTFLATAILALASAPALANEDAAINNHCMVEQHLYNDTYVYSINYISYFTFEPKGNQYRVKLVHTLGHSNMSATWPEDKVRNFLKRYNACSGMYLDPKDFK